MKYFLFIFVMTNLPLPLLAFEKTYSLQHSASVSPAQYSSPTPTWMEGILEYHTTKVNDTQIKGIDFGALVMRRLGKKATFAADLMRKSYDVSSASYKVYQTTLTPGLSYRFNPQFAAGASLILGQTNTRFRNDEDSETIFLPKIGGMYTGQGLEAGISYHPENEDAFYPSILTIHGRKDLDQNIAGGGILQLLNLGNREAFELGFLLEYFTKAINVDGAILFLLGDSVNLTDGDINDGSIFRFKLGGKYNVTSKMNIGAGLVFGSISGENDASGSLNRIMLTIATAL
jgi:hypothetical protein